MRFMAWSINIYILNLASSIPVGRSMWRRPRNFHDAGRSNQSCMGLNIPNYETSLVSHAQLSPFRWYNRHTLQLDDVEYIIKNIDSLHTALSRRPNILPYTNFHSIPLLPTPHACWWRAQKVIGMPPFRFVRFSSNGMTFSLLPAGASNHGERTENMK